MLIAYLGNRVCRNIQRFMLPCHYYFEAYTQPEAALLRLNPYYRHTVFAMALSRALTIIFTINF